jgi:hypothetical protein
MMKGTGVDIADTSLAVAMVFFLGLVLAGMGIGYFFDWAIRKKMFIFRTLRKGSWVEAMIKLWGFEFQIEQLADCSIQIPTLTPEAIHVQTILEKPRRRGRKPTYPIDRWKRVVLKWENRDPLRDTMTLTDLLAEEFGTHLDGSPGMAEQTYYDWRKKVFAEFRKEVEIIQASSKANQGNP